MPVLLLIGSDTPDAMKDDPETVAAALPDARIAVIEGQQHLADVLLPELFAEHWSRSSGRRTPAVGHDHSARTFPHCSYANGPGRSRTSARRFEACRSIH